MQIVYSSHRGSRDIDHIGSAHDDVELELLKAEARQRLAAGQGSLTWAWSPPSRPGAVRAPGRCRSPRRGRATCGMPCRGPKTSWALTGRRAAMRCSLSWSWRGARRSSASTPSTRTCCTASRRPRPNGCRLAHPHRRNARGIPTQERTKRETSAERRSSTARSADSRDAVSGLGLSGTSRPSLTLLAEVRGGPSPPRSRHQAASRRTAR